MKYLLLLFLPVLLFGCHTKKNAPTPKVPVTAFKVTPKTLPAVYEFVGVARSSHMVEIRSRVEGYLMSIDYVEGGQVDVNSPLFHIDPRLFEAAVLQAKGELERQEAIQWRAKKARERITPLFEKNAASQRDLDNAISQDLASQAAVIAAKANLITAELNLSFTKITSPVKGLAGKSIYREGTLITPSVNGLLTYVSVLDPIWVYFSVSDNQLLTFKSQTENKSLTVPDEAGFSVKLTLADGTIFPCTGRVNFTSPTLDPETGTLMVRAEFANPEGDLLPGQFVQAKVYGASRPNAFFVPQQSVFQGKKGMNVFVIDKDNVVHARSVAVGEWSQNYWIITSGLKEGEIVVQDGVNKVKEGDQVAIESTTIPQGQTP